MKKKTYIIPTLRVYRIDPIKLLSESGDTTIPMGTNGNDPTQITDDTF